MQQHQGQQAQRLGIIDQVIEQAAKPDGFMAKVGPDQIGAVGCRMAFVEDEIDDLQNTVEPYGPVGAAGHVIGDIEVADLGLGADDALGDRRRRRQEGAGDFLGRQAADFAQGERRATIRRQGGVATGEDQAQFVVANGVGIGIVRPCLGFGRPIGDRAPHLRFASPAVDDAVAAGRDQPGIGIFWGAVGWPGCGGSEEGLVETFFG